MWFLGQKAFRSSHLEGGKHCSRAAGNKQTVNWSFLCQLLSLRCWSTFAHIQHVIIFDRRLKMFILMISNISMIHNLANLQKMMEDNIMSYAIEHIKQCTMIYLWISSQTCCNWMHRTTHKNVLVNLLPNLMQSNTSNNKWLMRSQVNSSTSCSHIRYTGFSTLLLLSAYERERGWVIGFTRWRWNIWVCVIPSSYCF